MLYWVATFLLLGNNCFKACDVELSRHNFAEDMDVFLLWRKHDVDGHLNCVLQCYLDPPCASVQVSAINSSTCLAFKDGLVLQSTVANGQLHYLTCRDTTVHLIPKCQAASGYTFNTNTSHPFCFKVHRKSTSWNQARMLCHREGSELIELNSPDKLDVIQRLISTLRTLKRKNFEVWVGLKKHGTRKGEMSFKWDNTSVLYTGKWAPGQPVDQDCGSLGVGGLKVGQCSFKRWFICEIK